MSAGINSRNIDDLHPTVARGCREFIKRMAAAGYDRVGISSTLRDNVYQDWLFAQGRTRPGNIVTNARAGQSIHNYGLAFDFFRNVSGQAFNDRTPEERAFWDTGGRIWVEMGGVWGGNWTSFPDRPHCEFLGGLNLRGLQAGAKLPQDSKMPWEIKKQNEEIIKMAYKTIEEMPEWAQPGIRQLVEMRVLNGRSADNLDVDENMMRILLIVRNMFSRAGLLDTIAENIPS
jgi:hypothetical protein